jgi:site-specific recombinase XerD
MAHTLRPKTWATYVSLMRRHVFPRIGGKKVAAIQPADIRRVRDGIQRAGLSGTTALQAYRVLSHCLEDARRERLVTENVCTRVDPPVKASTQRGAFTVDEARAIIQTAAQHPNGSRYITQMLSGMRQSEMLGLTLDDIDLSAGEAYVRWQLMEMTWQHGCGDPNADDRYPCGYKRAANCDARSWRMPDGYHYRPLTTRYGIRAVPLIRPVVLAITHHLQTTTTPNPHRLVWRMDDGQPIPHKTDQAAWRAIIAACGLPADRTTHWARHSLATRMMETRTDTRVVGEIIGHGSTAVTAKYQHVSSALAHEAMRAVGELLA